MTIPLKVLLLEINVIVVDLFTGLRIPWNVETERKIVECRRCRGMPSGQGLERRRHKRVVE